jgi:PTS system mannose-specific IIA component
MVGVLIVAHESLAESLVRTSEMIVGKQEKMQSVSIGYETDPEDYRDRIVKAIDSCNDGNGVLVLTDMFGGTPTNICLSLIGTKDIEVVTGVNLVMLVKLPSLRESLLLGALAKQIETVGKDSIVDAKDLLRKA